VKVIVMPRVFISSRLDELKEERDGVESAILELWNREKLPFTVWMWEEASKLIYTQLLFTSST
jgi:hypothetical protein